MRNSCGKIENCAPWWTRHLYDSWGSIISIRGTTFNCTRAIASFYMQRTFVLAEPERPLTDVNNLFGLFPFQPTKHIFFLFSVFTFIVYIPPSTINVTLTQQQHSWAHLLMGLVFNAHYLLNSNMLIFFFTKFESELEHVKGCFALPRAFLPGNSWVERCMWLANILYFLSPSSR